MHASNFTASAPVAGAAQRQRCAGHRHLRRGRRASVGAAAAEAEFPGQ